MTPPASPSLSLKTRLGAGAAVLGAGTFMTALILYLGLNAVADRLDTALASENRMARYATLSQQAATFLVVSTEMVQTNQPTEVRRDRISSITNQLSDTFKVLHEDTEAAVAAARSLGLDAQSRYGTQSLGLARMQAMLANTVDGLRAESDDAASLRAYIDSFAASFDPLLSQAVNTEILFRNGILTGIEDLRKKLVLLALVIAGLAVFLVAGFYFGLVRPQFARLDQLRAAANRIRKEDFTVKLPVTRMDEIGRLAEETNNMAAALSDRQTRLQQEWAQLTQTIESQTRDLRAANAKLEEIDENRRRLFADVSHELRTPLTVILMEAQIGRKASPEAATAFDTIETRAARLNRRIDDLLRIAQSDSGQLKLDLQEIEFRQLIDGVVAEIEAEIDNAGMELEVSRCPKSTLNCDQNWIRQVLVSLIRNAIRHARLGRKIKLAGEQEADHLAISVIDNGPGIEPDEQAGLFDRFSQGAHPGTTQGFGVGLALARWVVEEHKGQISVISPVPRRCALAEAPGTEVRVCLPRLVES
ncbi:HAMP domain-containing sensor histidine kinase [uncultured Roseobacter sp.]|uniref:sensor histidine kinase n=1 Tax=uncultured Roseobacter sp. TaxID=114847 RepID=UPI00262CBA67|nr:HAMP domain-containing sensor histidine kinase [uncultured Roseobacter sp.]